LTARACVRRAPARRGRRQAAGRARRLRTLGPQLDPPRRRAPRLSATLPLARVWGTGHVVARPPGTRVGHSIVAGPDGITYLAYGTREPNDICFYPRSNKVYFRGVGLMTRLEKLDYDDGEPDDF